MKMETAYFWFRLFKTRGIGPKSLVSVAKILEKEQLQPEDVPFNQKELLIQFPKLAKILNGQIRSQDREEIYREYEELQSDGIGIIYPRHPNFPSNLLDYADKFNISPVLFSKGRQKLLTSDGVAIVGSRNVSDEGIKAAKEIAADLAKHGKNVVSGYAKGVDSEAHLGALEAEGTTTIVLSYGIKELRTKRDFKEFNWNRDVLAVSQFHPDARWLARNAMARNRLVCALSRAVVVIESGPERDLKGKMSGTFDAGKTALDMKLPLFVVTPKYFAKLPKGNEDLIDLGGIELEPTHNAQDIVEYLSKKTEAETVEVNDAPVQMLLFQM